MLLECGGCGKMYRVREGSASPPTSCPACKGALRPAGGPAAPAAPPAADPRVKELEGRIEALEKELAQAQAETFRLRGLEEKSQGAAAELARKDSEIKEKVARISTLEREALEARGRSQKEGLSILKEKDSEIHYLRERVAALEAQAGSAQSAQGSTVPRADLEKALQDKENEHRESQEAIARMGEDLKKSHDAHLAAIRAKDGELAELHQKAAALEKNLAEAVERAKGAPPLKPDAALERAQGRIAQLEKIVQDGERRYRELQIQQDKAGAAAAGAASGALGESGRKVADLERQLESRRDVEVALRRQISELQAGVEAERSARKAVSGSPAVPALVRPKRLGELRYLVSDLDKNLGSISTALGGLVERVRRLQEGVQQTEDEVAQAERAAPPPLPAAPEPEAPPPSEESPAEVLESAPEAVEAEPPAESEAPAGEEIATLETLPEPEPGEATELPADETRLEMGSREKKLPKFRRRGRPEPEAEPQPAAEASPEEASLSAETSPDAGSEEGAQPEPEAPKKKGLFSKLFGKKK
jgi:chromosome segregation ATPase